jgi:hypothetical protein
MSGMRPMSGFIYVIHTRRAGILDVESMRVMLASVVTAKVRQITAEELFQGGDPN